ncbi:hypothetical protein M5K25_012434 [Dendrobium thyrsiflorum]|uniref:Uncharacterized protein n=1 Tax=Dendrobium thyrsiflorum TaxID=117978 RepID=A0ABD0UX52_DENTH
MTIIESSGLPIRTQRHQIGLNPSPGEPKSKTRSAIGRFEPQFELPNGFQMKRAYSRIERLDETNPTSPRSLNSDIIKTSKYPLNGPLSRGSISAVHSNHSENTPDLSLIYKPCHSQKSINRALILHEEGPEQKEKKGIERKRRKRLLLDHRRSPPGHRPTPEFRRTYPRPPSEAEVRPTSK